MCNALALCTNPRVLAWSSIYRRRTFRISSFGKYLLSRRVSQTIIMARSDRPSGCRWPAIRRVALHGGVGRSAVWLFSLAHCDDITWSSRSPVQRWHHVPVAQEYVASSAALRASTLAPMPLIPRATRWLKMADDARRMAGRTCDPEGKRIMLEIAGSYDDLAAWAERSMQSPRTSRTEACGRTPSPRRVVL